MKNEEKKELAELDLKNIISGGNKKFSKFCFKKSKNLFFLGRSLRSKDSHSFDSRSKNKKIVDESESDASLTDQETKEECKKVFDRLKDIVDDDSD